MPDREFVEIERGRDSVVIEYRRIEARGERRPIFLFLHEGLGSVAMWKDFPDRICRALDFHGLVYSRPGYGWSTPRPAGEHWRPDFMHRHAEDLLPALLEGLQIDSREQPVWLFGHSDGGSIALLYAAFYPDRTTGVVALAPHIMVEDVSIDSIEQARRDYLETDLKDRLARYHADPDSAFWGWNDAWLDPAFRDWSIVRELDPVRCPVLALQGVDDEYGSLEQVRGIARRIAGSRVVELAQCGHSPHRDRSEETIRAVTEFVGAVERGDESLATAR